MKVKTSISLSQDVLVDVDRRADRFGSRSELIEAALRMFLDALARQERDARDRAILDQNAERLNREAADALAWQADV